MLIRQATRVQSSSFLTCRHFRRNLASRESLCDGWQKTKAEDKEEKSLLPNRVGSRE